MTELTKRCLDLPKKSKERLIRVLQSSLIEREDDGSRFHVLYTIAESIVGHGIISQKRDMPLVIGRRMIARQMRDEGYSLNAIGRPMCRHHASVIHMLKMWDESMELQYREEISCWKKFQKKLKDHEEKISSKMV